MRKGTIVRWAATAGAALLVACGGGGDGGSGSGGGGGGGGGGVPTGGASGRLTVQGPLSIVALEAEPNDSVSQPHLLGSIAPGRPRTMLGQVDAVADPVDGFRLHAPLRVRLSVTLTYGGSPAPSVDVTLYDPVASAAVDALVPTGSPSSASFHVKGWCDLLVRSTSGAADYELALVAVPETLPLPEEEENAASGQETWLGELAVGDVVTLSGTANAATDPVDSFLVACPASVSLSASLQFPAFQDFDLALLDATADLLSPQPLATFASRAENPEPGVRTIAAGTLLRIEVRAFSGSGPWLLALRGQVPPASPVVVPRTAGDSPADDLADAYGRPAGEMVAGRVLVKFRAGAEERARAHVLACGGRLTEEPFSGVHEARFPLPEGATEDAAARWTEGRALALSGCDAIEYAAPDRIRRAGGVTPTDTWFGMQWNLRMIHMPEAWAITTGSGDVLVAVIDTGRSDHPELAAAWEGGYDFVSDVHSPIAGGDGDGIDPDPTEPLSDGSPFQTTTFTHGTFVAGIIAASANNGVGIAGIGWGVRVMPLRVVTQGARGVAIEYGLRARDGDVAQAIRYAARLPNASGTLPTRRAHVINVSLFGPDPSPVLKDAIDAAHAAGVVVVACSGNTGTSAPQYPAALDHVISVGAVTMDKALAYYSTTGPTVDLVAPGGTPYGDYDNDGLMDGVFSTIYYAPSLTSPPQPTYMFWTGTSFAAAHVSGVVALMLDVSPLLSPDEIEAMLIDNTEDLLAQGRDDQTGYGLLDAYWAVKSASQQAGGPPVLSVQPLQLLLDAFTAPARDAAIVNLGGGVLTIDSVTVSTTGIGGWLSAQAVGWGDKHKTDDAIHVVADSTGLPPATYVGTVTVTSNGGTAFVRVIFSVGSSIPPPPSLPIVVAAIRADTGAVVQQVIVNPTQSLSWSFASLPVGEYVFIASSDVDGDGVWMENGEICGQYGGDLVPATVTVLPNAVTRNVDFTVAARTLLPGDR